MRLFAAHNLTVCQPALDVQITTPDQMAWIVQIILKNLKAGLHI
jgi:hypothetical protein